MKKVFYLVAVATLVFLSCERQGLVPAQDEVFTFKASIENFATKANMNDDYQLTWAADDRIGIFVNDESWNEKNQPFHLVSGIGSTSGEFVYDYDNGIFTNPNAAAAFFPWEGTGTDKNNVANGVAFFKLRELYSGYTSGKMLTPLVAPLSGSTSPISFKHAGAAVKVTINNLPSGSETMSMSANQQITGDFHIDPTQAGTAILTPDNGTASTTKNKITLKIEANNPSAASRAFTFIFPVPTLSSPNLGFNIKDVNDITVWSKTATNQPSIGRAEVLELPPVPNFTPYSQLTISTAWGFCGTRNDWSGDLDMLTDGEYCILKIPGGFTEGEQFKIRTKGYWGIEEYPSKNAGDNYVVNATEAQNGKVLVFRISDGYIEFKTDYNYPAYPYN